MAVLLTGGAGYIGSHTALTLLEQGEDIVVADNLCNSSEESLRRVQEITGKKLRFYQADVASRSDMEELFSREPIESVIHFAGLKAVGESVEQPLRYYRVNLDCTLTLLECMAGHGVKNLVFSSSATVYGDGRPPFREGDPTPGCTNPYGWTKLMIEQIITDAAAADSGLSAVLLRYFNPVGAHPSGRIGEDPRGIPNNLMPYIAQVASGRREKLTVYGDDYPTPDGSCIRDYLHVCDLAEGHGRALAYARAHSGVEIINLGRGQGVSVLEMVEAWGRANGPIPYEIGPRRSGDIPVSCANVDKARELLGWEGRRDVEDMCRDSWNWQRNNPLGYEK